MKTMALKLSLNSFLTGVMLLMCMSLSAQMNHKEAHQTLEAEVSTHLAYFQDNYVQYPSLQYSELAVSDQVRYRRFAACEEMKASVELNTSIELVQLVKEVSFMDLVFLDDGYSVKSENADGIHPYSQQIESYLTVLLEL